jgi:hypothetical protein
MYNGTNDYGVKKLTPSETIVSRTLQSRYRSFSNVVWRSGKPALDSEWNLINDMATEMLSSFIQSKTPSGWLDLGSNMYATHSSRPNTLQFYSQKNQQQSVVPNAIVNGWPVLVGGVGYTDTSLNSIALLPADTSRQDFVFLEVWRAQLRSRDTNNNPIVQNKPDLTHIYKFGNVQLGLDPLEKMTSVDYKTRFAPLTAGTYKVLKNNVEQIPGTHYTIVEPTGIITFVTAPISTDRVALRLSNVNLTDDLVDTAIKPSTNGIETSQRVQIQYRIRTVSNVSFPNTDSVGFSDSTRVQGQGANFNPQIAGYSFTNMKDELGDCGLWRAGNGDEASMVALGTVDGYSYATPMFKINRRSVISYSDTGSDEGQAALNQQGNSKILSDLTSDRPDGKFNDGIESTDIIDLRNKIFPDGVNVHEVLENNLNKLFSGELRSNRHQTLFYDSISNSDIPGYVDFLNNKGASGKRTYWSDSSVQQSNIYAEVKTTTTDNSLDAYRATGTGVWTVGDTIKIKIQTNLPVGTIIKATPRIYIEDKTRTDISAKGSWTGLNSSEATFTFSNVVGLSSYDIWLYYDIALPAGQGISHVPDEVLRFNYVNYASFANGTVIRGMRLEPEVTQFQDLFDHTYENKNDSQTFVESSVVPQRKQIKISPMIQTTSSRNGATRTLEVETLDRTAKTLYVPYALQHLRGVYTAATSGTELSMQQITGQQVSEIDQTNDQILIELDYFVGTLTSLKYDPTGAFVGSEIELLISSGGVYGPIFEHKVMTGSSVGTRVKLYTTSGDKFDIPVSALVTHFRWSGKRIKVRQGSNYGYDLNNYIIDCRDSDNNALFSGMSDRQQLWIDCDYLGAPHSSAELRIIYKSTPYQGSNIGSQNLSLVHKRERGFFFNNGTGGGVIDLVGSSGTSNYSYSPLSPKLPGSFQDYLRDGTSIQISSSGTKRFESDLWTAAYDIYGYLGGCTIWPNDFTMPSTPETTQRGFLSIPMLEAIFELPVIDSAYAEFILPILVKNKSTGQIYLMLQIGNKGVHKEEEGPILVDLFNLDERILIK